MIKELDNKHFKTAQKIHAVFQVSYAVEADLLNVVDFPPLKRTITNFLKSKTTFYGFFQNEQLAGVVEIINNQDHTHIQSLVVDPYYFRQGIAGSLMTFILETYNTPTIYVETGLDNLPAKSLYKKWGFTEIKQWKTDHGVKKVRFKKQ